MGRMIQRILYILVFLSLCREATGSYVEGCSSHCTMTPGESSWQCWDQTTSYFEASLLGQLRNFVNAEIGIAQWRKEHENNINWDRAREETVERMVNNLPPLIEDEDDLTDQDLYNSVIGALIKDAKEQFELNPAREAVPSCPHGCEKPSKTFFWLFIVSALVTVTLMGSIVSLIYILDYKNNKYVDITEETQKQKRKQQKQAPKG
ncbi:unnamed protein product [Bursaphelenchus okinawaensis]|uniref:Uncharacterized protein n=1 Tax=Bursaphelenchus okinawaensis TaxID=465554 RepID=A0A811JQI0_9BILA|nr:unnamed protein product [Bursaphelenchus okinawaensis]CAG9077856.1 unnamed protein product [Bursaphelenchus okinawaensis]